MSARVPTARRRRVRLAALAALVVAAVCVLGACGGPSYSDRPSAYIPSEVDGSALSENAPYATQFAAQLSSLPGVSGVIAVGTASSSPASTSSPEPEATPTETDPDASPSPTAEPASDREGLVLVAAHASGGAGLEELFGDLGGEQRTETIEGTDVTVYGGGEDADMQLVAAVANPTADVRIVAISLAGDVDAARNAISAMLTSGSS